MGSEIVQDHDVAGPQRRCEHLLDIGAEPFAVDRPIDDEGSSEPIAARAGDESRRLPTTVGDGADEALASRTTAIAAHHVGGDPGLVEEDETNWVQSPWLSHQAARAAATSGRFCSTAAGRGDRACATDNRG